MKVYIYAVKLTPVSTPELWTSPIGTLQENEPTKYILMGVRDIDVSEQLAVDLVGLFEDKAQETKQAQIAHLEQQLEQLKSE